ncbi:CfaE/CblD family pilus tip adhesin [Serratia fonticola]|uniref:CfaE/CblD family pilus tip adhesin n=1 Tax=Serratia fonticola TaxID=47917 RepID=UPI002DC009C7|nr:CfaE/CblD family pilus tip adhesin [Serratia fonticola]MEB7886708.1 hypothetical protein [Serratia fonticola]
MKIVNIEGMFLFALMMFFSLFVNSAEGALAPCIADAATRNQIPYEITLERDIISSVPAGTAIGNIELATSVNAYCEQRPYKWLLQIKSNTPTVDSGWSEVVCKTNIPGIGVVFKNGYGGNIYCNQTMMIMWVSADSSSTFFPKGRIIGRLIRTKAPLAPGSYSLSLAATLSSEYEGLTDSTPWGDLVLTGSNLIQVSAYSPQIYFPGNMVAAPKVDLNISNRPGSQKNTNASGHTSLDMCLYDGNNSSSSRISLRFMDEGASAPGRVAGRFSVYLQDGNKALATNRLDYRLSVINPTTGAMQDVDNEKEIIWTDTNRRNIQREVILPGVPGVSLCVPAPLTLVTPAFLLADKKAGRYTGKLRIIYTPTTQTAQ